MGGNFNYKKLNKDYTKNEFEILNHALVKQTNKIKWTLRRMGKINKRKTRSFLNQILSEIKNLDKDF